MYFLSCFSSSVVAQLCLTGVTMWTIACHALLYLGFFRHEQRSGEPLPSLEYLPHSGIKPQSPALQADSLPSEPPGKPHVYIYCQVTLMVKNLTANAGDARDVDLIPGSRRSPRRGNSNPLQYSCLENLRSLVGSSPQGCKEWDMTEGSYIYTYIYIAELRIDYMFLCFVQEKTYSILLIFSSSSLSPINHHVDIIQNLFQTVAVISNGCCYYQQPLLIYHC